MLDWLPYPLFLCLMVLSLLWPAWYFLRQKKPTDPAWISVVAAVTVINALGVLAGEVAGWMAD